MASEETKTAAEGQEQAQSEKLFTQEEVNSFIQARIGQMKRQASKESTGELDARAKELDAREMKIAMKEKLMEKGMPLELADVISCNDVSEIDDKLQKLNNIYGTKKEDNKKDGANGSGNGFIIGTSGKDPLIPIHGSYDPIRSAMGLHQ